MSLLLFARKEHSWKFYEWRRKKKILFAIFFTISCVQWCAFDGCWAHERGFTRHCSMDCVRLVVFVGRSVASKYINGNAINYAYFGSICFHSIKSSGKHTNHCLGYLQKFPFNLHSRLFTANGRRTRIYVCHVGRMPTVLWSVHMNDSAAQNFERLTNTIWHRMTRGL